MDNEETEIAEALAAIEEMLEERYLTTVEEHDPVSDELLLTWIDKSEREHGIWFSRHLVEELFEHVLLN